LPSAKIIVSSAHLVDLCLIDCLKHHIVGGESRQPLACPIVKGLRSDRSLVSLTELSAAPLVKPLE
jgi:hypothetical protein